ncbi:LysE family translocator [Kordiimonas aestuarii]|uniref:LysE family translocator n=1 Tax=Kordiimonas aestuarii TaxID=1005925 RepID=UPI0021CF74AF|nr:LysE family translocator [Kordiimonas aestuarii]
MLFELWLSFAVTSAVLVAMPGPTVMMVVSFALTKGKRAIPASVLGVSAGDFTAMTVSLMGAGALLAASALLFSVVKYIGAAYLIYLGVKMWRSASKPAALEFAAEEIGQDQHVFWRCFIVTALNPKGIVFFTAFLPQFINQHETLLPQFLILEATFITLAGLNTVMWALAAGSLRSRFARPAFRKTVERASGGFLISAGLLTAISRRAAS